MSRLRAIRAGVWPYSNVRISSTMDRLTMAVGGQLPSGPCFFKTQRREKYRAQVGFCGWAYKTAIGIAVATGVQFLLSRCVREPNTSDRSNQFHYLANFDRDTFCPPIYTVFYFFLLLGE